MIMDTDKPTNLNSTTNDLNKYVSNTNLAESVLGPTTMSNTKSIFPSSSNVTNELTLEMENTFEKKKNE